MRHKRYLLPTSPAKYNTCSRATIPKSGRNIRADPKAKHTSNPINRPEVLHNNRQAEYRLVSGNAVGHGESGTSLRKGENQQSGFRKRLPTPFGRRIVDYGHSGAMTGYRTLQMIFQLHNCAPRSCFVICARECPATCCDRSKRRCYSDSRVFVHRHTSSSAVIIFPQSLLLQSVKLTTSFSPFDTPLV